MIVTDSFWYLYMKCIGLDMIFATMSFLLAQSFFIAPDRVFFCFFVVVFCGGWVGGVGKQKKLIDMFLISRQKPVLWVLIRSTSGRHF